MHLVPQRRDGGAGLKEDAEAAVRGACRICHCLKETQEDPLVAPCLCAGSLRYVHNSCQQAWLCARRGPLEYRCELCQATLTHRLTQATRFQLAAVATTSVAVSLAQCLSAFNLVRFIVRLLGLVLRCEPGMSPWRSPRVLPPDLLAAASDALVRHAVLHLVMAVGTTAFSWIGLSVLQRPLALAREEALTRFCSVKIGGCVFASILSTLWILPANRVAMLSIWRGLGATLLLDTLLLAFLRIRREDRYGRTVPSRVARTACYLTRNYLPCAAAFFLWSASALVIIVASLLPCLVLLFREVLRDISSYRHRRGSVQLVLFVLCLAARLVALTTSGRYSQPAASGHVGNLCACLEHALACACLVAELIILVDLLTGRRLRMRCRRPPAVCCARDSMSQVMWFIAIAGEAALVLSGKSQDHVGALRMQLPPQVWRDTDDTREAALLLSIALFVAIHASAFWERLQMLRHVKLFRALMQIQPDQVVFCDRPTGGGKTWRWLAKSCRSGANVAPLALHIGAA